jgi:hypothetical protein
MANPNPKSGVSKITSPKGTRDLYPEDALKRRYLEQCWRDASVRCGFEEIHGPTFETTDLYSVKSGEGILGELFQAYSGKAPEEVEQVQATGRAPLRDAAGVHADAGADVRGEGRAACPSRASGSRGGRTSGQSVRRGGGCGSFCSGMWM